MKMNSMITVTAFMMVFSIIMPVTAQQNSACFGSGCHSDMGTSYFINSTRYDANSHGLLECIDCHNASLNNLDADHGKFLRVLNGTSLTAPVTSSQYDTSNYQLCYYCHNETKLTGLPAGYSNNLWTHRPSPGFPLSINEIGTNFVNELFQGHNFGNYPANLHWDHLDMHGINSDQMWDSNRDGILDSMPGCTACHDPHGNSSGTVLTRNDLGIGYGTDANGDYGILNNPEYLYQGGDVYCYGCHGNGSTFRYYRTSENLMEDCVTCHVPGDVNISKFARHANINTSDGTGNVTNNDCWTCHYEKDMNRGHVYLCGSCHNNNSGVVRINDSTLIISTLKHASNTCKSCHAPDIYHSEGTVGPLGRVENPGWQLISAIDRAGCHDCHRTHNSLDAPFHAPGIGAPGGRHVASNNLNNGSDCSATCHTSNTNPHNVKSATNTYKPGLSMPVLSPSTVIINNPVEVRATGSGESTSASLQIEAAQYQIKDSLGQIIVDWTDMTAKDGRFDSSNETVNATIVTAGMSEGTYDVSVKVMASGPRTILSKPYYPGNGDWSNPLTAALMIMDQRFINGTVRDGGGAGIKGAIVTADNVTSAITGNSGYYSLSVSSGTHFLIAAKDPEYYSNNSIPPVTFTSSLEEIRDIILTEKPTGTISGTVMD